MELLFAQPLHQVAKFAYESWNIEILTQPFLSISILVARRCFPFRQLSQFKEIDFIYTGERSRYQMVET